MKYLCLVYAEEKVLEALPPSEYQALVDESIAYDDELRKGGHYINSNALEDVATATTLRVRGGKATTTDGPFAETKEQLGGYWLIEARDLNEALRLASKIPPARVGSVEVRPIRQLYTSEGVAKAQ